MASTYPELENIQRLKVPPTPGEWKLVSYLKSHLDDSYEIFFNPYLDGDRPDIMILKEHCAAFIIEVKDWNLGSYKVTENNKWEVFDGSKSSRIVSPHSQVFRYKKNLYDLHLPVVGMGRLTNPNFYNLVHCFVYFHNSDKNVIDSLYYLAEEKQREGQVRLNQNFKRNGTNFHSYEKASGYLDKKKRNLQRDKAMSFGSDGLARLLKKINQRSKIELFNEDVYRDFKRRLSPPEHTLSQGIPIILDEKQLSLTISKKGKGKIKGVAGCGKTSILSQRSINAYQRHNSTVLILTFNITLKNSIRDRISDIQGNRDFSSFEISNYHQFYNSQVNNIEKDIDELIKMYGIEKLYSVDVFQNSDVTKYETILIDEIQDYQPEWVKIVRDNFLCKDGEMILFGDEHQNIYQREVSKSPVIAQGFGRWNKITRSYRAGFNSPLNHLVRDFQIQFLVKKYADAEIVDVASRSLQGGFGFGLLKYEAIPVSGWKQKIFESIQMYIAAYDLHPNDVVIFSSEISLVRQLNEFWIKKEKTHCMFETYEELAVCLKKNTDDLKNLNENEIINLVKNNKKDTERIRRVKKSHFYANSGLIKLSTIHSYKGLESKAVFYIISEKDEAELVYTSITRSSEHLVVFDLGSKNMCSEFLKQHIREKSSE